jgi:hypothetical protein
LGRDGGTPPSAWGAPSPAFGATPGHGDIHDHPQGTTVLVLGILGLVVCQVLSPIAWVMGQRVRREMDAHPEVTWTNRGSVTAGWVCGIIGSVLLAMAVVSIVIIVVIVAANA